MTEEEFREEAKELGYTKEEINEWIVLYEESKEEGVILDFSLFLIENPEY